MQASLDQTTITIGPEKQFYISMPDRNDLVQAPGSHFALSSDIGKRSIQNNAAAWSKLDPKSLEHLSPEQIGYRLWTTYRILDKSICDQNFQDDKGRPRDPGTTAATTVYDGKDHLITATIADSVSFAAVYDTKGTVVKIIRLNSENHTVSNQRETSRIQKTYKGIYMDKHGVLRVGELAVSRAIGASAHKQFGVTSESLIDILNIKEHKINAGKIQIITGCNGFIDGAGKMMQSKTAHEQFLLKLLNTDTARSCNELQLAQYLVQSAKEYKSNDNVTVSIQTLLAPSNTFPVFQGVYDGHGGNEASHYVAKNIVEVFTKLCTSSEQDYNVNPWSVHKHDEAFARDNLWIQKQTPNKSSPRARVTPPSSLDNSPRYRGVSLRSPGYRDVYAKTSPPSNSSPASSSSDLNSSTPSSTSSSSSDLSATPLSPAAPRLPALAADEVPLAPAAIP